MNVFKLLSRAPKAVQSAPTQKLPSSGAAANPQLFGRDQSERAPDSSTKSRKRKRGQDAGEEEQDLPPALDFFSWPSEGKKRKRKNGASTEARGGEEDTEEATYGHAVLEPRTDATEEDVYDEAECKRILRSHKLKIVVLEDFAGQDESLLKQKKEKKEKKKSKKRKHEEEEAQKKSKKKDKKQLFPRPLESFAQLRTRYGISRKLAQNIEEQGYTMPTEVQLGTLPLLLGSKKAEKEDEAAESVGEEFQERFMNGDIDLLTVAPTGSGKTIAFLIPIINGLLSEAKNTTSPNPGPRAIVLAPTRELASQIVNEARKLAKGTGIKSALMKKGMEVVQRSDEEGSQASLSEDEVEKTPHAQKRTRKRADVVKAAILVATPLALLNALRLRGDKFAELPSVNRLVLDEADVLLDPLFREQALSIWNSCTNPALRVGLWSATMGSSIESLVIDTLNSRWNSLPSTPALPPRSPLVRVVVGLKDTAIPNISHKLIYAATEQGKLLGLRQLLHPTALPSDGSAPSLRPPFLVFTQTIPRATALHSELLYDIPPEAGGSSRIAVLHANLSSSARSNIMTRFRRGEIWVLITTDLLARGVDFRGLNGVVNYDVPNSAAAYVHRVGRTGRAGREGGVAVTYYTKEDIPYIKNIANVIRASEKLRGEGEGKATIQQWLLDALPTPTKREKQRLKKRGVEARRTVKDQDGRNRARISTKSGYERRIENRLRGAKANAKKGPKEERTRLERADSESEFEGFDA
ncbi:P-loop containing nucleoside triphosphate hydrolase protein [Westerdykella ornata]|uniref:ATP-dependent RNA helicase ROK1 n=1 Tax=Westerdykella ornata TaxID=318751 RepID=A0A6A6JKI5_WESOR|nr:P-loop containing nucleoside triphosphate hydrolase protein [Westerdykella ornata]KAF2277027.1 P-loop containing nucleoside triphosphate hydrolase protein [Westerdykella ornata]